ncbi:MAG: hypothetical protein KGO02_04855 [Alphaproteobacteria bacterium]|nr:hypothetical protein [Alphaproteobacteria bacterium]
MTATKDRSAVRLPLHLAAIWRIVTCVSLALSLGGCFDIHQSLQVNRDGGGSYAVSVTAQGLVGEALAEKPLRMSGLPSAEIFVDRMHGQVRQTTRVRFTGLDKLKLPDETISLRVLGHSFFGLGPAHVQLRQTLLLANARRMILAMTGQSSSSVAPGMVGRFQKDVYVFSVTLPGSVLRANPLKLDRYRIVPTIRGNFWNGHTVTWRVPLVLLLDRSILRFDVEFSAYGHFTDVVSLPLGS